jgi:hypothetical protein
MKTKKINQAISHQLSTQISHVVAPMAALQTLY